MPNSCSREPRAVELGLDEPGRDVVARLAPARLAERAAVLDQVERERARERQHPELRVAQRALDDELLAHHVGIRVAEDLVAELDDQLPVVDRQAHDLGEDPHRDLRGDVVDPVERLLLERRLEDPARELADPLLVRVDDPRREALVDDRPHPRVRRRVGVEHRLPRLELLRGQILRATCRRARSRTSPSPSRPGRRRRSACSAQKPRPSLSGCQKTGASRRRSASQSYGTPRSQMSRSVRSTSSSARPVERRPGDGRRARRPPRGRGRRGRAPPRRRRAAARAGPAARPPRRAPRRSAAARARAGVSTSPVRTSNSEPWHGQTTTRAVELALRRASTPRACTCPGTRPSRPQPRDADGAPAGLDPPERSAPAGRRPDRRRATRHPSLRRWTVVERLVERWHTVVLGRVARPRCRPCSRRVASRIANQTSASDDQPERPVDRLPVVVRAVVRVGVERAVEAEDRRDHGDRDDQVLPPVVARRAHEPEREDGEDQVDELDRERADRRREDERRELVVREERARRRRASRRVNREA